MAMRYNPQTGRVEDDAVALVRPTTGAPIDTAPDEVTADDLIVGKDPRKPYAGAIPISGRAVPAGPAAPTPTGYNPAAPMIPLPGKEEILTDEQKARLAANEHMMGLDQPRGMSGEPDRAREALDAPIGQPAPAAPAAPPRRAGGGGGGGGGTPTGGHLTAAEAVAQGGLQTAQDEQAHAIRAGSDLEARKAGELAGLADAQAKEVAKAQTEWQAKRKEAEAHLAAREDAAAKTKVKDIFEGRPLAQLLSALAVGVGGAAATMAHTENFAIRITENAAKAYRERQQEEYLREMKGVENERDRLQFASMHAAADEAGLYRRFEMDRTKLLQTYGADEARLKGDTLLADWQAKRAAIQVETAGQLYKRGQDEIKLRAEVAAQRASAAHSYASAAKLNAEAAAGAGAAGEGRAATTQIQKATLAEHGQAALDVIDELQGKGVQLSKADLARIQDNRTKLKAGQDPHGLKDAIGIGLGRTIGAIPRSEYDGLSAEKQKLANAYDILAQKGAALVSPSHSEDEIRHARAFFELSPTDDDAIRAQKLEYARNQIGTAKEMGGRYTEKAFRGAEQQRAAAPAAARGGDQVAEAIAWLNKYPNDPDAPAVRAKLQQLRGR